MNDHLDLISITIMLSYIIVVGHDCLEFDSFLKCTPLQEYTLYIRELPGSWELHSGGVGRKEKIRRLNDRSWLDIGIARKGNLGLSLC